MHRAAVFLVCLLFLFAAYPNSLAAQQQASTTHLSAEKPLLVGVYPAPPFAFKDNEGEWTGISIELFKDIAEDLERSIIFKEYTLEELLKSVEEGKVDVAVTALSITAEREEHIDFSHPFYTSHLGIAVSSDKKETIFSMISRFFSWDALHYIAGLLGLLFCVGILAWIVERKHNPEQFRKNHHGLLDGLWWAAATMTTVGYGDIAPKSPAGRIVALGWMFISVGLMSFFIAGFTTTLTMTHFQNAVQGPEDLVHARTAAIADASSIDYLRQLMLSPLLFPDLDQALDALVAGQVQAVVHDKPLLLYANHTKRFGSIRVLSAAFDPQQYGFAFKQGSPLRKPINVSLLSKVEDLDYWRRLITPFLGKI